MEQETRNRLRAAVTRCRTLLETATLEVLQGRFGVHATPGAKDEVSVEDEARLGSLSEEDRACRRDILAHLEHVRAAVASPKGALERLVRAVAFTHLNRLCAFKMMESRGIIREAV